MLATERSVARDGFKHSESLRSRDGASLAAASKAAGGVLFVERAWPPIVWGLAVAILFLAVSWLGAWLFAPRAFASRA